MAKTAAATHVVEGVQGKRVSPRTYTHATVVRHDPAWLAEHALPKEIATVRNSARRAYAHYQARAAGTYLPPNLWRNISTELRAKFAADEVRLNAEARELVAQYPTVEAWQDKAEAAARTRYATIGEEEVYEYVQAWHLSERAAAANARKIRCDGWHGPVRVATVTRIVKGEA
jgi:hypothetical protein